MENSQLMTRRVFVTLSGIALATTSGCLGFFGTGSESESGEDSGSSSDSGSDSDDSTTNESSASDDSPEPRSNSSENTPDTEHGINETNEAGSEESEAAVPESNPRNDPSQTEPADPNTTEPPTDNDIERIESTFSASANEATITVRNTADERVNSIDLWVIFYNDSGQQVDERMNGATSVDPEQTVTITVACEATDATTFEIQRVMVST